MGAIYSLSVPNTFDSDPLLLSSLAIDHSLPPLPEMRVTASLMQVLFFYFSTSTAAPVSSDDLTMANFASMTGKGMW